MFSFSAERQRISLWPPASPDKPARTDSSDYIKQGVIYSSSSEQSLRLYLMRSIVLVVGVDGDVDPLCPAAAGRLLLRVRPPHFTDEVRKKSDEGEINQS